MPTEPSIFWGIVVNGACWAGVQLALAWLFTRMPEAWFRPPSPLGWEATGRFYEKFCCIKAWKDRLPDGARWVGGAFAKRSLAGREAAYLQRFITETWRGELCHWTAIACTPLFLLWNPPWGGAVNLLYALAANLPCILVQRYNRTRLLRLQARAR